MSPNNKFSVRQGIEPQPSPAADEVPKSVRYFVARYLQNQYARWPHEAGQILADFLHEPSVVNMFHNPYNAAVWTKMHGFIESFKWWEFYDFVEMVYIRQPEDYKRDQYVEELNAALADQNVCYRMDYRGHIVYRGSESFETAVRTARSVLNEAGKGTAKDEIHKALEDLNRRPPDLTGAVHHAMSALECVANDVCGESGKTLGDIIKKNPERFPQPLGDAVSKLYGYASNHGRHISEGGEPNRKEVELIVGIASSVATYLCR
jgi:hypothetical protein